MNAPLTVLAIDTATEILGLAVARYHASTADESPAAQLFVEERYDAGLQHGRSLGRELRTILRGSAVGMQELDLVVVSGGPGSFTGLRIGMSTAKGIAAGCNLALVAVPTLDRFAGHLSWTRDIVVPLIDARKKRFYAALYREGKRRSEDLDLTGSQLRRTIEEERSRAAGEDLPSALPRVILTGPHADRFRELFATDSDFLVDPECRSVSLRAMVAEGLARYRRGLLVGESQGPEYVRQSDARRPGS